MVRRAAAYLPVQRIDIGEGDVGDFQPAQRGQDVGSDLLPVTLLRPRPLARQVLLDEPHTQISDCWGLPPGLHRAQRIGAGIDLALEMSRFLARRGYSPIGVRADGETALAAVRF